jgi:hypothetical protein
MNCHATEVSHDQCGKRNRPRRGAFGADDDYWIDSVTVQWALGARVPPTTHVVGAEKM